MGLPCVNSESIDRLGIEGDALALRLKRRVILRMKRYQTLKDRVPPRVFGVFVPIGCDHIERSADLQRWHQNSVLRVRFPI
jgi:hypothetical protein